MLPDANRSNMLAVLAVLLHDAAEPPDWTQTEHERNHDHGPRVGQ